jgi:glutamate-1-semialdehyde 2,1-aminomutase/spore coat polysaccharide biosynthesis protein SpsF
MDDMTKNNKDSKLPTATGGFPVSEELWQRAMGLIPTGTQTLSKAPNQFIGGITPKYLKRGDGSHVWDVDGNEYIDYPMALGPILLGYNYKPVVDAVVKQIKDGTTFTLMHPLEVEVAELLRDLVSSCDMVRFGKNGADVTSAAVRAARAYTGKDAVAYCGYHGCQDWYAVTTPRNKGIPKYFATLMHAFEYNKLETLEKIFAEQSGIAAVIMEVPGVEPAINSESGLNFLQEVAELARRNGAVFILDEIVTGFRFSIGGAQEKYNVEPDLSCFGKGMANGFPISAVVGKKEFMKEFDEVFFSMTYSGDTIGLAAAKATLFELREKPVIKELWRRGELLHAGVNKLADELAVPFSFGGQAVRGHYVIDAGDEDRDLTVKSLFLQETIKRGILFGGPVFISYSHSDEDILRTIEVVGEAFEVIKKALASGNPDSFVEGEKPAVIFRKRK